MMAHSKICKNLMLSYILMSFSHNAIFHIACKTQYETKQLNIVAEGFSGFCGKKVNDVINNV